MSADQNLIETLHAARDVSAVLLCLEFFVLAAVPLVILYFITRSLGRLIPQVTPFIRSVHTMVLTVLGAIESGLRTIRAPFIWLHAKAAAIDAFVMTWQRRTM